MNAQGAIVGTMDATLATILQGNARVLDEMARAPLVTLATELDGARRVFVTGAGRSGLIMQLLAIRLGHLGMDVTILGLPMVPPVQAGDLLVAASGSGETDVTVGRTCKAKELGARVAVFTARADSRLAACADVCVVLPAAAKNTGHELSATQLYDGALFEQSLFLTGEALFHELALHRGERAVDIWARHANVE